MTMPPVFGDFLAQASGHLAAAVSIQEQLPAEALDGVVRSLDRVVTTLTRYLGDVPLPGEFDQGPSGSGPVHDVRAALDARIALRRSAQVLRAAAAAQDHGGGEAHPAAWHLAHAADQLIAGRDLLHTHFASDPSGAWTSTSSWATVTYSPPVTDAMLGEIGSVAAQLAPWMMRLSLNPSPGSLMPATLELALHDSSRWLWTAGLKLEARSRQHPPSGDARLVLASTPPALPPAHPPVAAAESVPELSQGVITTAARLQHAATAFAQTARWSPQATSYSWGRDALACAITSHSSEVIIRSLGQRADALGLDPMIQAHLDNTARALNPVCIAWRAIADEWSLLSTGANHGRGVSRVANEIGDLVLRIGRLAYASPEWTPASGDSLARDPADLAPAPGDLRAVLTAIHHATDTMTRIAATDHRSVHRAATDGRLYIPTRLLPADCDIPHPYAPAPLSRVTHLLDGYRVAAETCAAATAAFDGLALAAATPSRALAAAHALPAASRPHSAHQRERQAAFTPTAQPASGRLPDGVTQPGHLEDKVRNLQLTEPALLLRASAIDEAARNLLAEATAKAHHQAATHEPSRAIPPHASGRRL